MHKEITKLAKTIDDNETLSVDLLASKLAKLSESNPEDKTMGTMLIVLDKMANNNVAFIRRADLKKLYNQFYSFGTSFGENFTTELGQEIAEPNVKVMEHMETVQPIAYEVEDQILANALNNIFDSTIPLKPYSETVGKKAISSVNDILESWNVKPSNLSISDGNEKFIIVQADYQTPKGLTSFFIPVEVNKNDVKEPNLFLANSGPQDLNYREIKAYLTGYTGAKLKVSGSDLLEVLVKNSGTQVELSEVELAASRVKSGRQENQAFASTQIFGIKVAEVIPDVATPKYDEFESFEQQFTSAKGQAHWQFGNLVEAGRNHISRELASFGHKANISIVDSNADTILYSVSLNSGTTAFTVPIKVADKKLTQPNILICNGSVMSFDQDSIKDLIDENKTDIKAAAVSSVFYELKPSEVVNNLRVALSEENYVKAEDALNVLIASGDERAYKVGFQLYMNALGGKIEEKTQCNKVIKTSSSNQPICSHTGLPVNKVYQDKAGHCHPLYRRAMDESYEGASFLNAKIFG